MTSGASLCSVTLRDLFTKGQNQPMGALPPSQGGSRRDDDDDKYWIDCDWPEKHDISRILFLLCSAVSGIDQSRDNLDNLLPPPGLMGNRVFPFLWFFNFILLISIFFFFLFPAWASDWLFYFFFVYSFASCILTPPTCSTFALWCHHVIITIINIIIIKYKVSLILGSFGCC